MYLPYLRGKQFELLALRELITNEKLSKQITPIIEPIKVSSTLKKTLQCYFSKGHEVIVIFNPKVGDLSLNNEELINYLSEIISNENLLIGCILDENLESNIKKIINSGFKVEKINIIHQNMNFEGIFSEVFSDNSPRLSLIPEGSYRRKIKGNKVILADRFNKQVRNSDYINCQEEFYSSDHLYYKDENYLGFSDFTIVSNEYSEGGFLPYAVAIHITYFDENKDLKIRHFVSDSNTDSSDTAKKFYEALGKLISWTKTMDITTLGLVELKKHHENKTYPGLGAIKKYCIMHHIELMSLYLDGVKE